jgi:hypothetical protein
MSVSDLEYNLDIPSLLEYWGFDTSTLHELRDRDWRTVCLFHEGADNEKGAAITYYNGRYYYRCFTHGCTNSTLVDIRIKQGVTFADVVKEYRSFQCLGDVRSTSAKRHIRNCNQNHDTISPLPSNIMDQFVNGIHTDLIRLGYDRDMLRDVFMVRYCNDPHSELYRRYVWPIRTKRGDIVSIQGRLPEWDYSDTKYRFLNGRICKHVLFGQYEMRDLLRRNDYIVVCEGAKGVFRGFQLQIPTLATLGVNVTEQQIQTLASYGKCVIVIADNDPPKRLPDGQIHYAGWEGACKLANELRKYVPVSVVMVPRVGTDISDYRSRDEWIEIIRNAK